MLTLPFVGIPRPSGASLPPRRRQATLGAPHMVRSISQMTRTAKAQMLARQTINTMPRRPSNLLKGTSVTALAIASSATKASIDTTEAVERKPSLVMGALYPRLYACVRRSGVLRTSR
jgi:hypothetical protein